MRTENLSRTRFLKVVFYSVAILLTAQVIWWTSNFLSYINELSQWKKVGADAATVHLVDKEAYHKRVMFLSESAFFLLATGAGIFVLYRALRVEERARKAQKSFVEIMSHESKTPLTALKLRLESVSEKRQADEELKRELSQSLLEVRRLSSLFDKAMSLSRADSSAQNIEVVNLSQIVRSVLNRMEPVLKERKVELSLDLDSGLHVRGDIAALQSSVQSLVENSVYYNDRDRRQLGLSLTSKGKRVLLFVDDNGPGIPPEEREHVFEKFYRGSQTRNVPGSGLGLYLAKKLVEAHHGGLEVLGSQLGGVRFSVDLPRAEAV